MMSPLNLGRAALGSDVFKAFPGLAVLIMVVGGGMGAGASFMHKALIRWFISLAVCHRTCPGSIVDPLRIPW